MDGRKNNKGTIGNNGGRPPKADEVKLAEQMDAIGDSNEILTALFKLAKASDIQAQKLWLSYRFGQPKQQQSDIDRLTDDEKIELLDLLEARLKQSHENP